MNYNDGYLHDDFYNESESNLDKIADDFSEGCIELKNCLLTLWNNNIKTIACCAGHEYDENPVCYIMISIDKESAYRINNILNNFFKYYGRNNKMVDVKLQQFNERFSLNLYFYSLKNRKYFFDLIRLSSMKNNYNVDNAFYYMSILSEYAKKYGETIMFDYTENGGELFFGNVTRSKVISLKRELEIMKQIGLFSFGGYYCDEEDLKNLATICYGDIVYGNNQNSKK